MSARQQVLQRLNLRTSPFAPEVDKSGVSFKAEMFAGALDPTTDARLLEYYFDLYDWKSSPLLNGISNDGLKNFPGPRELAEEGWPLMILISGFQKSGRGSLTNLILHKIKLVRGDTPITIQVQLNSPRLAQAAKRLADVFVSRCGLLEPTPEQLRDIYDHDTQTEDVDGEVYYPHLFEHLSAAVRQYCSRPIVFVIRGGDHYDVWKCLYLSSTPLADYLIVETPKIADALTCYSSMSDKSKNIVHISAPKLNLEAALKYVRQRIVAERDKPVPDDPLAPFTAEAIDILFTPGSTTNAAMVSNGAPANNIAPALPPVGRLRRAWRWLTRSSPVAPPTTDAAPQTNAVAVTWAIGWIRRTLWRVLQEHINELVEKVDNQGPTVLNSMTRNELFISKDKLWRVRQEMNQGR